MCYFLFFFLFCYCHLSCRMPARNNTFGLPEWPRGYHLFLNSAGLFFPPFFNLFLSSISLTQPRLCVQAQTECEKKLALKHIPLLPSPGHLSPSIHYSMCSFSLPVAPSFSPCLFLPHYFPQPSSPFSHHFSPSLARCTPYPLYFQPSALLRLPLTPPSFFLVHNM